MECALSETRSKYFQGKESGSPMGSPITSFLSPNTHISPSSSTARIDNTSGLTQRPNRVVLSLFKEDGTSPSKNSVFSVPSNSRLDAQLGFSIEKQLVLKCGKDDCSADLPTRHAMQAPRIFACIIDHGAKPESCTSSKPDCHSTVSNVPRLKPSFILFISNQQAIVLKLKKQGTTETKLDAFDHAPSYQ